MPLTKRAISPVNVSRHRLPATLRDGELECVSNGTLANLVRQMSSLSRHAENIYGEIYHEAMKIDHRMNQLTSRLQRLGTKVQTLDPNEEDSSLQDFHLRKQFKSNTLLDQQSLARQSMPAAMAECYARTDPPPDLNALSPFRTDGRPGLSLYTDPGYFFDLWRKETLKDGEKHKQQRHRMGNNVATASSASMSAQDSARRSKQNRQQQRRDFEPRFPEEYQTPEALRQQLAAKNGSSYSQSGHVPAGMVRPGNFDGSMPNGNYRTIQHGMSTATVRGNFDMEHEYMPPPPPPQLYTNGHGHAQQQSANDHRQNNQYDPRGMDGTTPTSSHHQHASSPSSSAGRGGTPNRPRQAPPAPPPLHNALGGMQMEDSRNGSPELPPPPPPLMMTTNMSMLASTTGRLPSPPAPHAMPNNTTMINVSTKKASNIPQAPPPPPPNFASAPSNGVGAAPKSNFAPTAKVAKPKPPPQESAHDHLLNAIRAGTRLKKVSKAEEADREADAVKEHDVAAILQRRMKGVMGESSDDDSDKQSNTDDWDD